MILQTLSLLMSLAVAPVLAAQLQQAPPVPHPDTAGIAGWYEDSPNKVLVVWGPTGGYRLLDFAAAHFHRLEAVATDRYRIVGGGDWENALADFKRDRSGRTVTLRLTREALGPLRLERAENFPFDLEEVRFSSGATELAGLLMMPRVRKWVGRTGRPLREVPVALPGVVFIHGSGDSDRDNVWAFTIAQRLASAGFATLLPDKRGSGASGGDWRTTGLDGLAQDALAAVALLRDDRRVDASRVGLVGLSQGGVVAPLAATRSAAVAFVVSISAAPIPLLEQIRHETLQDLIRNGVSAVGIDAVSAVGELGFAHARGLSDLSWSAYAAAYAELTAGPFAAAAGALPATREDWRWAWLHTVGDVDPLPAWRALAVQPPALAIFGELDEHDNVPVRRSVALLHDALRPDLHPDHAVRVFPGLGHALIDPAQGWVSRDVLDYLETWLLDAVAGPDPGPS